MKEGDALRKDGQLEQSLEKYGLAISVDPKLVKAYQARAEVNELLGHKQAVAKDRMLIAQLVPEDGDFGAAAAMAYLEVDSPAVARRLAEDALKKNGKNMQALQARTRGLFEAR